ncbi:RsmD family RNA methyltransferase [Flavobacteriaceae bacterium]|nr:RsmD family RNA methyltransferase [Flavobacteriaceae bacterium]
MNTDILSKEVQEYINNNLEADITKLVLKGSPFNNISTTDLIEQIEAKKKCKTKLPTWFKTANIYYPNKLNIEQTSSEETAKHKLNIISGNRIIDLTGGYGVDCVEFSKNFDSVIHCELNNELSEKVAHNIKQFGIPNITCIKGDSIKTLDKLTEKLDCIYVDPSRRHDTKGKVFLLKDCLPNVPEHLDLMFSKANSILIKNSPLIDITSCINELKYVKEFHIIALNNEVKEVLVLLEKDYEADIKIISTNLGKVHEEFKFTYNTNYEVTFNTPLNYLYEPNSAILKGGGFNAIANKLNIAKLHKHSHLYTSSELQNFPGRVFKIDKIVPYNKKKLLKEIPSKKANITIRNFKESVAAIRKKTGIKEGGDIYLFCTTNSNNEQIVIICSKV